MADTPNGAAAPWSPNFAGLCVTAEDFLSYTTFGNVAGVRIRISGRVVDPKTGAPIPLSGEQVPNSDRTLNTTNQPIGAGVLQALTVSVLSGTPSIAALFVRVEIVRGSGAGATPIAVLVQGFLSTNQRLAWPGSLQHNTIERPGMLRRVTGTNPAAGAEISETVPTGARWRPLAILTSFVADATVITRGTGLQLDDGTTAYYILGANQPVTAGQTRRVTWGAGMGAFGDTNNGHAGMIPADLWMLAGHRIRTNTTSIQAGDDYAAPEMLIEEKLEGA